MARGSFAAVLGLLALAAAELSLAELPGPDADGWHTWRTAATDGAPELCCFGWNQGVAEQRRCNLDSRRGGFTVSDQNPFPSDDIQVYVFFQSGKAQRIRTLSAQCPVAGASAITDRGTAAPDESVAWLRPYITPRTRLSDDAIAAVALHAGDAARDLLVSTATSDADEDTRETAVFWMGQARIDETAADIRAIMFGDGSAHVREHAGFSYSQSSASDRGEVLIRQGRQDRDAEVRAQAWFWLAQVGDASSERAILEALSAEKDSKVREGAIFALSQLPEDRAVAALGSIVEDGKWPQAIREEALFWLAQAESDAALGYIDRLFGKQ